MTTADEARRRYLEMNRANSILNRRWPDAKIGERQRYSGPIIGDWIGPGWWEKAEGCWIPAEHVLRNDCWCNPIVEQVPAR